MESEWLRPGQGLGLTFTATAAPILWPLVSGRSACKKKKSGAAVEGDIETPQQSRSRSQHQLSRQKYFWLPPLFAALRRRGLFGRLREASLARGLTRPAEKICGVLYVFHRLTNEISSKRSMHSDASHSLHRSSEPYGQLHAPSDREQ